MKRLRLISSILALPLVACGGGGGDSGGGDVTGIGGTGSPVIAKTTGTITGFGSIFVNGVEFETDTATIEIDDNPGAESDLRLGMVVSVTGNIDDNGTTGTALSVTFDNEIKGPVSGLITTAAGTKQFTILGITVIADPVTTVFDDITFAALANDDLLEVSGFHDASSQLHATRIEKESGFQPGVSEIELKGTVADLDTVAETFSLGSFTVAYSSATNVESALANGQFVEVDGTLDGTTITAIEIKQEDDFFGEDEDKASIEGIITNFDAGNNTFTLNGQTVDASSATLQPATLTLSNNLRVEAEGPIVNGVLQAVTIEARDGDLELSAQVTAVNGQTITVDFFNGSVSFEVTSITRLDDKTGVEDVFTVDKINIGDFLEVELINDGTDFIATEVRRDDLDDDELEGPVDSFVANTSVTLLGVTFNVNGSTQYQDNNEIPISATTFFSTVAEGATIKVQDDLTTDGIADEIEQE